MAFNAADFNTNSICQIDIYFYPTVSQFYDMNSPKPLMTTTRSPAETISFFNTVSKLQYLVDLVHNISPLPGSSYMRKRFLELRHKDFISMDVERKIDLFIDLEIDTTSREHLGGYNRLADCLLDTLARPSPRFTLVDFSMAHNPFYFDESGNFIEEGADNPKRYPAHHAFSAKTLLKLLDLIFEHDPNPVIVLQADHGLHGLPTQMTEKEISDFFSCAIEQVPALWHHTMSAIRLPLEHMTQEAKQILSDPLNISRYLVNNFVGENYDYIPRQFKQNFLL